MATHSSVLAWRIPGTGAWWVAVYGVAQSRTQLMWLSSIPVVTNEVPWTVISVQISLSYCFHLHISGPLESLPQSVTKLYRRIYVYSYTVSHLCWQAIFSYSSISGLCQNLFPKRTLKMSLYCCHCCYAILWDHYFLLRIISSCVLQSSKSCEEPR